MPKKKTEIILIVLILIDIISIWSFVSLYNYSNLLINETINAESTIKKTLKKDSTKILMKNELDAAKNFQEKLAGYIIPEDGTVDFIKIVEQLILNSGVQGEIKTVSNEQYEKGNALNLEVVRINIDVTGKWSNIKYLLDLFENYPIKLEMSNISFSKFSNISANGKNTPEWTGSIEFTVVKTKDKK